MSKTSSDKILLSQDVPSYLLKDVILHEACYPGHLLELLSTGKYQKNDSGYVNGLAVVLENETLAGTKDDVYTSGDTAPIAFLASGMVIQARVPAAASAIVIGDKLTIGSDGVVQKLTAVADLTDSTTGTADGTLADGTATYSQTIFNNNFADVAAKLNAVLPSGLPLIAIAEQAVDNSGGGSTALIKIRVA